jgi:predicted nucleic acid-binding protein
MARYFVDTSALVKHYHAELGSPKVDAIWADPDADLCITRHGSVELLSALAAKVRAGLLEETQFLTIRRRFLADAIRRRKPRIVRLLRTHFQEAESHLCSYGIRGRLRANDAIQLSVALQLKTSAGLDHFVSADKDLLRAAAAAGLSCIDPEAP